MRIRPLLRNVRHRAMIARVRCLQGSFILARVTGQFIVRLISSSNGNCPLDWNSNSMLYANPLLQKNIQPDMNYIFKNT